METIDAIKINFNPDQLFILNLCLAFLMFAVALDIRVSDFKKIFQKPKAPLVGLISQLLLLPLLTLGLVYFFHKNSWFNLPGTMALGMLLVAVCPGGNVSNYAVHLSKSNAALSVMLTSITTLSSIVITPLAFVFWSNILPFTADLSKSVQVEPYQMFRVILLLIFIPLVIGMAMQKYIPHVVEKISKPVRALSMIIFIGFVVAATLANFDNIVQHFGKVFWLVLIHNSLAFLLGYYFAQANGLSDYDKRAITIETGIQNSGLALILIFNFFDGIGGMAMVAAWWGIWHLVSGFCLAIWWSRQPAIVEKSF